MAQITADGRPKRPSFKRRAWGQGELKRHGAFLLMLMPGFLFLIIFHYLPLPGILTAFKSYKLIMPPKDALFSSIPFINSLIQSPWVGLENFKFMFTTPDAMLVVRNTLLYSLLFMACGLVTAVSLALAVNELRQRFMAKVYHTLIFLPFFMSWIIVAYVVYGLCSTNGMFNGVLKSLGKDTVNWYGSPQHWPAIFLFANLWRFTGNGSIIYLATLSGFSQELYEAAAIDGANKWKQMTRITLPLLVPTIVLLQILAVGRIFSSDFDMFYSLPNGAGQLRNVSLTIDVYVYNTMKSGVQLGLPAAAGLLQSAVGFFLILTTNYIVRKAQPEMALF